MSSTMSCGCSSYASRARAKPADMSLACMNNVYQAAQGLLHHTIPLLLVPKPPCLFFALEWNCKANIVLHFSALKPMFWVQAPV